jgi:hypothetical protein
MDLLGKYIDISGNVVDQCITVAVSEIARGIRSDKEIENIFKICEHISANSNHIIEKLFCDSPFRARYSSS